METKYIFITGGVVSSLGKGLTSASIAMLLEKRALKVAMIKLDPYLNVDPGTMNPYEHGEVYVTDDGAETDLDLGHYYRYTENVQLSKLSNTTSGQVFNTVIKRERKGDYLGKTVQLIPHVTDEIKNRILAAANQEEKTDVVIVEIGGSAGDIESLPFIEAIRQFRYERPDSCINIHLTYIPYLKTSGELKSKPTQHSVQTLRNLGVIPDILLCRSDREIPTEIKNKISLFCNVARKNVFEEVDVANSIYEVPLDLYDQGVDRTICEMLHLPLNHPDLGPWRDMLDRMMNPKETVVMGIVGKYLEHKDAYKCVFEALHHAAIANNIELDIRCFESDKILNGEELDPAIKECEGILVPGGFGERGWIGKIMTSKYCRENKIPFFGICLGMQVLTIDFARHVLELEEANSTEMDPKTPHPIISLLSEQKGVENMGGTMRLGAYSCILKRDSKAFAAYGKPVISERHRHRWEFNNAYTKPCEDAGLIITGTLDNGTLCEIVEVQDHPWMVGVQYHPEFKSKPGAPHPLFRDFVAAMVKARTKSVK